MKLLFISDLHGSAQAADQLFQLTKEEKPDKTILLGDLLAHGPRNELPEDYAPKHVIHVLNSLKTQLLSVRGNCDAEVDQMVLEFPVLADYLLLWLNGHTAFVTHGHLFNESTLPPLHSGDILIHGHTHIPAAFDRGTYIYLNPGSITMPKENHPQSYLLYTDGRFDLKTLDGTILKQLQLS